MTPVPRFHTHSRCSIALSPACRTAPSASGAQAITAGCGRTVRRTARARGELAAPAAEEQVRRPRGNPAGSPYERNGQVNATCDPPVLAPVAGSTANHAAVLAALQSTGLVPPVVHASNAWAVAHCP